MDAFEELLKMAGLASGPQEPTEQKIQQWQTLFSYTRAQATAKINERTMNFDRRTISDEVWDEIKAEWISKGYDKDAYEHSLDTGIETARQAMVSLGTTISSEMTTTYLVKLDGQVSSPEAVQALLGLERLPDVKLDSEDPTVRFCYVSARERSIIAAKVYPKPTFISLGSGPSPKDLDSRSRYPTLGIDTTLPQYRAVDGNPTEYEPGQDQYPVWYFFYGNLAKPEILGPRLGIDEQDLLSKLTPARIHGGQLASWRGKYKALLDGDSSDEVCGWDFLVTSKEIEDWLRAYETSAYEVVRCNIERQDGSFVPGCVFRFCGGFRA